jgi:hypothetical protein
MAFQPMCVVGIHKEISLTHEHIEPRGGNATQHQERKDYERENHGAFKNTPQIE